MGVLVVMVLVFVAWVLIAGSKAGAQGQYASLLASGIPGRGILLSVSRTSLGTVGTGLSRYQLRAVTIDVEVAGRRPYEVSVTALIPMNLVRDVLPGATVELRVDPKDPTKLAIVGPGVGFNAASLLTQGQTNQGAA